VPVAAPLVDGTKEDDAMIGRGAALALMGMLAFSEPASAQEMPGVAAQIDAAGMRFTRALNGEQMLRGSAKAK
jgi:hypothetical protein